jgi:damage-control phosphatase, subfamily I
MNIGSGCFSCMINQVEKVIGHLQLSPVIEQDIMKEIFSTLSKKNFNVPAPFLARDLHEIINNKTGIEDTFKEEKELGNRNALKLLPLVEELISKSSQRLETALRAAISGNIIDYGAAAGSGEEDVIRKALDNAMKETLPGETLKDFLDDCSKAKDILYIGDNTGEIAFDTFLVKELPALKKTFAVRGKFILNDATMEDALLVSMDSYAEVITSGDNTPGVDISRISSQFARALKSADMIIAKGQGNLETLYNADLYNRIAKGTPVYFLFKVKCKYVAEIVDLPQGTTALLKKTYN